MASLVARLPVIEIPEPEGAYCTTIVLGHPTPGAAFGDEVVLTAMQDASVAPFFVGGADAVHAADLVPDVLGLFGYRDTAALVAALSRAYGTGLPENPPVTVYSLYETPVEEWIVQDGEAADDAERAEDAE